MCDYCDCRSQPEIAGLSTDHDELLSLVGRLRRAISGGHDWTGIARELADRVVPHARREEAGVLAALRAAGADPAYLDVFVDDHAMIEALAAQPEDASLQLTLADLLEDHILREETDLFPAARQLVAPSQWEAAGV